MTHKARGSTVQVTCEGCQFPFLARTADRARGWGRFCSKACSKKARVAIAEEESIMADEPEDPMTALEPGAIVIAKTLGRIDLGVQLSQALSLKRLADAAEEQNRISDEMLALARRGAA